MSSYASSIFSVSIVRVAVDHYLSQDASEICFIFWELLRSGPTTRYLPLFFLLHMKAEGRWVLPVTCHRNSTNPSSSVVHDHHSSNPSMVASHIFSDFSLLRPWITTADNSSNNYRFFSSSTDYSKHRAYNSIIASWLSSNQHCLPSITSNTIINSTHRLWHVWTSWTLIILYFYHPSSLPCFLFQQRKQLNSIIHRINSRITFSAVLYVVHHRISKLRFNDNNQ